MRLPYIITDISWRDRQSVWRHHCNYLQTWCQPAGIWQKLGSNLQQNPSWLSDCRTFVFLESVITRCFSALRYTFNVPFSGPLQTGTSSTLGKCRYVLGQKLHHMMQAQKQKTGARDCGTEATVRSPSVLQGTQQGAQMYCPVKSDLRSVVICVTAQEVTSA